MTSLRAVDEMNLSLWQQLQLVRGTAEEDLVARVEAAVTEAVDRHRGLHRDRFPYLHHPGTLVYLKRCAEGEGGRCVALGEESVGGSWARRDISSSIWTWSQIINIQAMNLL